MEKSCLKIYKIKRKEEKNPKEDKNKLLKTKVPSKYE
jgi:hypothetical protein